MFGFSSKQQSVLHLTWAAFFLTFMAWFNMAPFNTTIMRQTGLTAQQIDILMISNVVLTIPARIVIGTLADRFGPRRVFCGLLLFASFVCLHFALAVRFTDFLVSRLLMGIVGGGFVVGIKMIAEWFPPEKMGTAQGIYAGWGNFGAAAAAFTLPPVALLFPEETGWRMASGFTGMLCLFWAFVYFRFAEESRNAGAATPFSLLHAIEVTSRKDVFLQILLMLPLYGAVAVLLWKLSGHPLSLLPASVSNGLYVLIGGLFILSAAECVRRNRAVFTGEGAKDRPYAFQQIFILSLVYALTFGSALAVISMFPEFLQSTFSLSVTAAGIFASSFAFMNLVGRPAGGWLSDRFGRRRTLVFLVAGALVCYFLMGGISASWPLGWVVGLSIACSLFLQAGSGACFAVVPLVRRDLAGKMAGLAGAYGNVGAVFFLTFLSMMSAQDFFRVIGAYALLVLIALAFLKPLENPDRPGT